MGREKSALARQVGEENGAISAEGQADQPDGEEISDATGEDTAKTVRIVAIGASAGGLEPFERFFDAMPAETGLAFVVIQHLSPDFRSMMDELLARHSSMAIHRVENGMAIEPNAIYLNPPRSVMTIEDGKILLQQPTDHQSLNLPINTFLESLAIACGKDAIGVIFSGTGLDGTKGCQAIRDAGGAVFAQEPTSAKFDGMPTSVINHGLADAIAPPEALASLILSHVKGNPFPTDSRTSHVEENPLKSIFAILKDRFGADFNHYKISTVERRIRRRSEMHGLSDIESYASYLDNEGEEAQALYNDLLIEVTAFFRDSEAFSVLENDVVPTIARQMSADRQIRIWVPGCASGEEAYSIAILFAEYARKNDIPLNMKILATDLHSRSLDAAGVGTYPEQSLKGVTPDRIARYFKREGSYFHVRPELRRHVVFSPHNLLRDPPFTRMDLVSCRNVLIYFNDPAQQKVISLFHFALIRNGHLFLGPSETVGRLAKEFDTISQRWRIFKKSRDIRLIEAANLMTPSDPAGQNERSRLTSGLARDPQVMRPEMRRAFNEAIDALLLQYAPAGYMVSRSGELVHVFGNAGRFITVGSGGFSRLLVDILPADLRSFVAAGLERARGAVMTPFHRTLRLRESENHSALEIEVRGLPDPTGKVEYILVTIEEKTDAVSREQPLLSSDADDLETQAVLTARIKELEQDLKATEESLQTTIEELETSNEELQASNEELMASNEELQSTNEELHSVNEELYTVSAEHQRKIEELTELTNDMDHLLKSTEIGTIFLDSQLQIRRFTPAATKSFNLIAQDVSRPISHVTYRFDFEGLSDLIAEVQTNGEIREREVTVDDKSYILRILPYAASDPDDRNIVITIIDISEQRKIRDALDEQARFYSGVLEDVPEHIVRWSAGDGRITYCNDIYAALQAKTVDEIIGQPVESMIPLADDAVTSDRFDDLAPGETFRARVETTGKDGRTVHLDSWIRAIGAPDGTVAEFQVTGHDATDDVRYLDALEALIDATNSGEEEYQDRINALLEIARIYFNADHAIVWRSEADELVLDGYAGLDVDGHQIGRRAPKTAYLSGVVLKRGRELAIRDVAESEFSDCFDPDETPVKMFIGAPLSSLGVERGVVGFVSDSAARTTPFTPQDIGFLHLFTRWIAYKIERREQLARIRTSEQELKHIFDNVPARILYKDGDNRILRLNEPAARALEVSVETATGASAYDFLSPETAKEYHEDDLAILESGKPEFGIVREFKTKSGETAWVSADKIPFVDELTGEKRILAVSTDITQLKQVEVRLNALNEELERQREDYLKLYRKTPTMMHSIGPDGVLVEVSDHWLAKLGYERDEVIGRKSVEFLTEEARAYAAKILPDFWRDGYCFDVPYQMVKKDGGIIDVELSGVVDDSFGNAQRSLGVMIDVSDRNRALSDIARKARELEQANESLEKFAYVASHDLQEPLRKIRQFSEMLVGDYGERLDEEGQYFLDVISDSASRMSRLIRDLLTYSRTSNQTLDMRPLKLASVISDVVDDLVVTIEEAGAEVSVDVGETTIVGDPTLTGMLFANLIGNGIKYRDSNRPARVDIATRPGDDGVEITVSDNGIGFDNGQSQKIFDPFVRLHQKSEYVGSGIGLAICRSVCERHSWRIDASSERDKGSTFTIVVR